MKMPELKLKKTNRTKRCLLLMGGTMRGAFIVGVVKALNKKIPPEYFHTIASTSVGVFEQASYATNQIDQMELVWTNYVDGDKLISFKNIFKRKPILDLDYLINIFQQDGTSYNVAKLISSPVELKVMVANYKTKEPKFFDLKENVWDSMKASCALPFFYNRNICLGGTRYVDTLISPKDKFRSTLTNFLKSYDEVVCVCTHNEDLWLEEVAQYVIRPSKALPSRFNTKRECIIKMIAQGEKDTETFLNKILAEQPKSPTAVELLGLAA